MTDKDDNSSIHVESHNQQGGITAGVINVNESRTIANTQGVLEILLRELMPFKGNTLSVTAEMGNGEALKYAEQVREWLRSSGFTVEQFISQVVWVDSGPPISYSFKDGVPQVNIRGIS